MTGDVPLIERAMVDTMLVTIDVMKLVVIYGHLDPRFVLWSCRLCEYATAFPGEAATLRSIGQHMTKEHGVRLVAPA